MSKKKATNVSEQIVQRTYFFAKEDAKKRWYAYDEDSSETKNGGWHDVEAASVRERMEYILNLAEERGFTLTECRLEFNKIPSDSVRKEVTFNLDNKNDLRELGFKEE